MGAPTVVSNTDGRLEIFAQGYGGSVWHNSQITPGGGWTGWNGLDGTIVGAPSAAVNADGTLIIFAQGSDGQAYFNSQGTPGGSWSGWNWLGMAVVGAPSVGTNADGRLEIFAQGTDGSPYHNWQVTTGGGWSGWVSLGGTIVGPPTVITNADGRLEVFVEGYGGSIWYNSQINPGGGWTGWNGLDGWIAVAPAAAVNANGVPEIFAQGWGNSAWYDQATEILEITNLTHPNLMPDFAVGDTFQVTISNAPPDAPVFVSQTPGTTAQVGQTDDYGNFTLTGIQQSTDIGSFTQVWSVGGVTLSPALSFVVGDLGTGTLSATSLGETADGHLEGVSTLAINNGVISTYSATALDYTASLYYDSDTVATLFDEGNPIAQSEAPVDTNTATSLSANANAWDDYDLQTDHYAVAFFVSGGYYENPLYWGNSCYAESGDCSIDGGGSYAFYVEAAFIYVGSTLADQSYVPPDEAAPAFDLSAYDGFLASANPPLPKGAVIANLKKWATAIATAYATIRSMYATNGGSAYPPLPYYVDLQEDDYGATGSRERTFLIRDTNGHAWNLAFPIRIRERFTNVAWCCGATPPTPNGIWYNGVPPTSPTDQLIDNHSQYTDYIGGTPLSVFAQGSWVQYYYATDFTLPPSGLGLSSVFTVPGVSGVGLPLWIKDVKNQCAINSSLLSVIVGTSGANVYINGDGGPHTGCR